MGKIIDFYFITDTPQHDVTLEKFINAPSEEHKPDTTKTVSSNSQIEESATERKLLGVKSRIAKYKDKITQVRTLPLLLRSFT